MSENKIVRIGPNPTDYEVVMSPEETAQLLQKAKETLKSVVVVDRVYLKNGAPAKSNEGADSLIIVAAPQEDSSEPQKQVTELKFSKEKQKFLEKTVFPGSGFVHDMDISSMYMYEYVPYSLDWGVRCKYRIPTAIGFSTLTVEVSSSHKHARRLRQIKKKMAHTKTINRQAVRDEYKATIARREQFTKHINSGLRIRNEDKRTSTSAL